MNKNNYIKIKIKKKNFKQESSENILSEINKYFDENELFLKKNNDNDILIYLNSFDINKFESFFNEKPEYFQVIKQKINKNKSYGIDNGKKIYIDYNKERKVKNRKKKETARGKYYYAKDNNFKKQNNKLTEEKINQIVCADSLEYLKTIPDNSIDLIFTSPPYNFGLDYEATDDSIKWQQYLDQLFAIFDECIRVLKYGGRFAVNIQPLFSDYIPLHHIVGKYFIDKKMIWKTEILWEKNNYNCKYTAWGSWKSPSSPYFKYTWEFVEVYCKGDIKKTGKKENIDITADEFKEWVYSKWSIAPERNMKEYDHPAMFPEELARRILKLFSYQEDIILDPFGGVGTVAAVAKKENRKYISIDISEEYTKKARERVKKVPKQLKLNLE
ncbi:MULTISPECIES: site-specific DNA-methyltransferase [unclassified Halanaerobium]|uniref:DNA-methyltransferase n=1 Tax=unclassified Halanaerobium TaxID=2641197 RepID=UPI000DF35C20|nr:MULTISPECIES: site-specific DNA-methyltransferase [unclassified Halanaerobium]RCW46656.1 DNA modification methylase [Halanaerobium sp. MA284_MarDTE_T2]RCW83500.1 DNA modification methylase [Halanaerobium sp. DL-01]